jgi:hypothetical protein
MLPLYKGAGLYSCTEWTTVCIPMYEVKAKESKQVYTNMYIPSWIEVKHIYKRVYCIHSI